MRIKYMFHVLALANGYAYSYVQIYTIEFLYPNYTHFFPLSFAITSLVIWLAHKNCAYIKMKSSIHISLGLCNQLIQCIYTHLCMGLNLDYCYSSQ